MGTALLLLPPQFKRTAFGFISSRLLSSSSSSSAARLPPENSDAESDVYRRALKLQRPTTIHYHKYLQTTGYQDNLHNFVSLIGQIEYPLKACSAVEFGFHTRLIVRAPARDLTILLKFRKEMAEVSVQHLKLHDLVYVSGRLGSYLKAEDGRSVRYYEVDVKEMNFVAQNVQKLACQPKVSFEEMMQMRRNRLHLWHVFFANPSEWWDNRKDSRNSKLRGRPPDFRHKDTGEALWINDNDPPWVNQQLQLHDSKSREQRYRPDRGLASLDSFGL